MASIFVLSLSGLDEIAEEGFQSFSLVWTSVRAVIRDREHAFLRIGTAEQGIGP